MATLQKEKPDTEILPSPGATSALLNGRYAPPPADQDGKTWVRTSAVIQAPANTLYEMWADVEASPAWHERVVEVRRTGANTHHWTMRDEPGENLLEWEFETLAEEPGKRIAWRSVGGEPESAGEVLFEPAPGGRGTMVTLLEQFHIGKFTRMWEAITGRDPKQSAVENLRHFKALAETGEIPRTQGQPHGDRGISGKMKRSMYAETISTPPAKSPSSAEMPAAARRQS